MLGYLTLVLVCQLTGEIIAKLTGLPVPGPVIGMVILFLILCLLGKVPKELENVSNSLLGYLTLLFVPAGVGVITNTDIILKSWAPITGAIVFGTAITIGVTGFFMQCLNKFMISRQQGKRQ
ncbi:CidA/LrgA family protein [Desulforegula conservatrix]|uniref:CidA/LrgA family protein n=1 Tax=Desulforegula conservatrix TaxID=153026 RepID=UPI0003FABB1E|nr:CidA/LrgA family protein [Desulforegula conservatrix]